MHQRHQLKILLILGLVILIFTLPRLLVVGANNLAAREIKIEWRVIDPAGGSPYCKSLIKTSSAERFISFAAGLSPSEVITENNSARKAWLEGDCEKSEKIWKQVINSAHQSQSVAFWMYWLGDKNMKDRAESIIGQEKLANFMAGSGTRARYADAIDTAISWYELAFDLYPSSSVGETLVNLYKQKDEIDNAKAMLGQILELKTAMTEDYWWTRGQLAELDNDLKQALEAYIEGAEIAADPFDLYIRQAKVLERLDDWDGAEDAYRKALGVRPDHILGYIGIGNIERREGNFDEALAWYQKANYLDPQNFFPIYMIGELFFERGEILKAKRFFEDTLVKNPHHDISLYHLALIFNLSDEKIMATETLEQAIEASNLNRWQWLILLGDWYREDGENSAALSAYQRAVQLNPDDQTILDRIDGLTSKD
jgi:tetratricopeptide (TPR) repeat protein